MIYLDNSATTKVDKDVMDTFVLANENFWGNESSLHNFGALAEQVLLKCNRQILDLLAASDHKVIFTGGATESNNLAIKGLAANNPGGHIITTKIEHPSIYEVCKELKESGFTISYIDVSKSHEEQVEQLKQLVRKDTFLVSCMHVNSEIGLTLPIKEFGDFLEKHPKIKFHVDAVQSIGKIPVNIEEFKIDILSASAHKIHGIKGIGCLIVRNGVNISAQISGGGQMAGIRSGTVNVAGAASFAKALRLVIESQTESLKEMYSIYEYVTSNLARIEGVRVNNRFAVHSPYIVNFWVEGVRGETMVHALADYEIYISAKSACSSKTKKASHVLTALGFDETAATESLRASFTHTTTMEEVKQFLDVLAIEVKKLRSI